MRPDREIIDGFWGCRCIVGKDGLVPVSRPALCRKSLHAFVWLHTVVFVSESSRCLKLVSQRHVTRRLKASHSFSKTCMTFNELLIIHWFVMVFVLKSSTKLIQIASIKNQVYIKFSFEQRFLLRFFTVLIILKFLGVTFLSVNVASFFYKQQLKSK